MGSLDSHVATLNSSLKTMEAKKERFKVLLDAFPEARNSDEIFEMCLKKGVYPYEHMVSQDSLEEKQLPPREAFYSQLSADTISEEEYNRGQAMWRAFDCNTMRDYTMLYVVLDVLLLAAVFENFRETCIQDDGLDAAHFVTAPSLSWASMLLMNWQKDVVIENMTDLDMLQLVQRGIRGGMCQVMKPYARRKKGDSYEKGILYLDANNLYGWAMRQYLPLRDYRWEMRKEAPPLPTPPPSPQIPDGDESDEEEYGDNEAEEVNDVEEVSEDEIDRYEGFRRPTTRFDDGREIMEEEGQSKEKEKESNGVVIEEQPDDFDLPEFDWYHSSIEEQLRQIMSWSDEGERGYILEVDLDVPNELHDYLNDYPPCPSPKKCYPSEWTREQFERIGVRMRPDGTQSGTQKLVCDLEPKRNYVIHYRNLQQALRLGLKLEKVHCVISFVQSPWMADYIDHNTRMRAEAKANGDNAAVVYRKLKNNSVYGKTVEDVAKRRNIKFFLAEEMASALRAAASPFCKAWKIISKDELLVMELAKHSIVMNRPVIIGFTVLELSKWLMFDFHYNKAKQYWGENVQLLYTDTDSTCYKVKTVNKPTLNEEVADFQRAHNCLDLTELKPDHYLRNQGLEVKSELGMMKDEMKGVPIEVFIALRAKMYSILLENNQVINKMKGIPKSATIPRTEEEIEEFVKKNEDTLKRMALPPKGLERKIKRRKIEHKDYMAVFKGEVCPPVEFVRLDQGKKDVRDPTAPSKQRGNRRVYLLQTIRTTKKGLANTDDKSYYFDANHSVRFGHWRINEFELSKELAKDTERGCIANVMED